MVLCLSIAAVSSAEQKRRKKRNVDHQMNNPETAIDPVPDLPISIISDILSRLPIDDVARYKRVCKSWYNLSKDPHFTHLHFTRSSQQRSSILLWEADDYVFNDDSVKAGGLYLISNREEDGKWKAINISPEAAIEVNIAGRVVGSCNGLLCINTHSFYSQGPSIVYNPLTKDAIALPELDFHPNYDRGHGYRCGFGFDPTNKKFKVVLAYKRKSYGFALRMTAAIITLGETSWRTLQFPHDLETDILNREPLFFNGAFHWVIGKQINEEYTGKYETHLDGILPLDISTENFQAIIFSRPVEIPDSYLDQTQMENSLIFARTVHRNIDRIGPPSLAIWQIQGANPDENCLYKHWTSNVHVKRWPLVNDLKGFRLLGAFANGVFLFKAYPTPTRGEPLHKHLVLYDAKKHESSVIKISGAPKSFNASIFQPSFISPTM